MVHICVPHGCLLGFQRKIYNYQQVLLAELRNSIGRKEANTACCVKEPTQLEDLHRNTTYIG